MADKAAIQVNLKELKDLANVLKVAQPELAEEIGKQLLRAGRVVARKAEARASWSSRIPGSVKVRRNGFTVSVVAGSAKAPHAAPFENNGVGGSFRHPVFGNRDNWVAQKARPFLAPAFFEEQDDLVRGVITALDIVFRKAGFR